MQSNIVEDELACQNRNVDPFNITLGRLCTLHRQRRHNIPLTLALACEYDIANIDVYSKTTSSKQPTNVDHIESHLSHMTLTLKIKCYRDQSAHVTGVAVLCLLWQLEKHPHQLVVDVVGQI